MDVYDGTKKEVRFQCEGWFWLMLMVHGISWQEELSRDQKAGRLTEVPSLIECLSHSFFIGGYFVGPQFSMRKFKNYIEVNRTQDLPSPVGFGFKRLAIGWVYMIAHLIGSGIVSGPCWKRRRISNCSCFGFRYPNLGFKPRTLAKWTSWPELSGFHCGPRSSWANTLQHGCLPRDLASFQVWRTNIFFSS